MSTPFLQLGELADKLQEDFEWIGERNVYEFVKELGLQTIKPDRQVRKVLLRLKLISEKSSLEEIIGIGKAMAKEVSERPCTVDWVIWRFGREVCKAKNPLCDKCQLQSICSYFLIHFS